MKLINNRYSIIAKIGEGSMGIVYKARDLSLSVDVIVKIINFDMPETPSLEFFKQEFQILRSLRHPHIVGVHDFSAIWSVDGHLVPSQYYLFSMDLIEGWEFLEGIRRVREEKELFRIVGELLTTMNYIHYNGFLHNDISSRNIYITEEDHTVKFLDFGISEVLEGSDTLIRMKRAGDFNDLIHLLQDISADEYPGLCAFVKEARDVADFEKGGELERLFDIFNAHTPGPPLLPAHPNVDHFYTVSTLGLEKHFAPVNDFLKLPQERNKVLFLAGDIYSEVIPFFYESLEILQLETPFLIRFKANTIMDTLNSLIKDLQHIDVENKFLDTEAPEIKKILAWDDSVLMGDSKFIVYNRLLTILQSLSDKYRLTFSVTYITSKREEIASFLLYLMNGLTGNNLTWIFFDLTFPLEFRKRVLQDTNVIASFTFETLPRDIFRDSVRRIFLLPESLETYYAPFFDVLYQKTKGKCALLATLSRAALEEGLVSYAQGLYHYDTARIMEYPFSFSYDNLWHQRVDRLSSDEKIILTTLAFYEKYIPWEDTRLLFSDIPDLEKKIHALVKENLLVVTGGKTPVFSIKGQLFVTFLLEEYPPPEIYARRTIAFLLGNPDSFVSLESFSFLLAKMKDIKEKMPRLFCRFTIRFLKRYARETHRPEVRQAVSLLEETLPRLPRRELFYRGREALGLFYYYANKDEKALEIFQSIDADKLHHDYLLSYYLNYSKLLFFLNEYESSLRMCRKGALLSKKEKNSDFRYYFLNVKGMIYSGRYRENYAMGLYEAVYNYLLRNGVKKELSNFVMNYFNILIMTKNHSLLMHRGKEILKNLKGDPYQVNKAKLHALLQMAQSYLTNSNYSKALEYLNKAYALAKSTQSYEEMISILNSRVVAKYYIYFDNERAIEDLKETIAIAKKHQAPSLADSAFFNIVEAYQDCGRFQEALEAFRDYARSVIAPHHKKNIQGYLIFLSSGARLYIRTGQQKKAFFFLRLMRKHMRGSAVMNSGRWENLYLMEKAYYYFFTGRALRETAALEDYLMRQESVEEDAPGQAPVQEIIEVMLNLLYAYHRLGRHEDKNIMWDKVNSLYPEARTQEKEFNWPFYQGLVEEERKKAASLFEKGMLTAIRQKDFTHIDLIAMELLNLLKNNKVKYFNISLLLYFSLKMVYDNLPPHLRPGWSSVEYIRSVIREVSEIFSFLPSSGNILSQKTDDVVRKVQSALYRDFTKDNIRKAQALNRALWSSDFKDSLRLILLFLRKYLLVERIMISLNDSHDSFGEVKYVNARLYSAREKCDETLVQNAYMKGDYVIRKDYSFGSPLTTLVIPLINPTKKNLSYRREKRMKSISFSDIYLGYIYADTKLPLSNVTPSSVDAIKAYTELIQMIILYNQLHEDIILDKTTYLLTRHAFLKELKNRLRHHKGLENKCAFLMIDIDHFKKVNDRYGHQKGDEVLWKIASLLKKGIRRNDLIGRYGGEEFIAVLFNLTRKEAEKKTEELRQAIEKSKIMQNMPVTISIGGAIYPDDSEWINILINQADSALLEAKNRGRNRALFWNKALRSQSHKKDSLYGIITEDFSRSENMVRNLLEFFDVSAEDPSLLFEEMIKRLIIAVPHTHYAYRFTSSSGKEAEIVQENCLFDPDEVLSLDPGYHILANWRYLKEKTGPIHYDLIFTFREAFGKGFIIFSSPTTETEYNEGHYNLVDKFFQIFRCKLQP